jgi:mRNA interferase RelE/StbE
MNRIWHVEFDERAAKELRKLAPDARKLILRFFKERIETELDPMRFGKALTANFSGLWRYRIEDYRVICQIQDDKLLVLALKIGHRREVYR